MPVCDERREAVLRRLGRIEGQVRGIRRLVEEERYCIDVLTQVAAVHEALRGVAKVVLRDHLEHCVTDALRADDAARADRVYEELMDVVFRYAR